jgi:membrane protease YdiL (CAAX protease family)
VNGRPLRIYFWLAFGITWGMGGLGLLAGVYRPRAGLSTTSPLYYAAAYGPSLAGLIMTGYLDGWGGIGRLLVRALPTRAGLPWYLAVLVGFPAISLLAGWVAAPEVLKNLPRWDRLLPLLAVTAVADPGPLGEEFGWRGFALPRLLRRRPPLAASLILGVIWGAWHLPTFFIPALPQSRLWFPLFVLNSMALSVIMTWLYLRTDGDLLLMILVHLLANYCVELGVPFIAEAGAEIVCAAIIVSAGGLRSDGTSEAPSELRTAGDWDGADSAAEG